MSNQYPGSPGQPPYGNQPPSGGAPGPGGWDPQQPASQPSAPPQGQPTNQPYGQPTSQPSAPQFGNAPQQGSQPPYGNQPSFGSQPPQFGPSNPQPAGSPSTQYGAPNPPSGPPPQQTPPQQYGTPATQVGTAYDSGVTWQQGAPSAPPPAKKSGMPKVLLAVGVGVVVLALLIGGFAFFNYQQQVEADKKVVQSATDTVQGYLDAVSSGDAEKALGYAATKPTGPLLTGEIAQAAAKEAGITGVTVTPAVATKSGGKWTTATVQASYTVDGKQVSRNFPLTRSGDRWTLAKVTATVALGSTTVPFKINGASVTDKTVEALPGKYTVTSDSPVFEFASASFTVTEPGTQVKWLADSKPTDKALADAKAVLANSFQQCLKETNKFQLGAECPFSFASPPPSYVVDAGSIRFTNVGGDPFANAKFTKVTDTDYATEVPIAVTLRFTGKLNGQQGNFSLRAPGRFVSKGTVTLGTSTYKWYRTLV